MDITEAAGRPAKPAPAEWFTGEVWLDRLSPPDAVVRVVSVTFTPGARTHWHTHPNGQLLTVVSGLGRAQSRGGPVKALRPGDVVWFGPGEEHWHGAAPGHLLVHVAVQAADAAGRDADWLDPVADADHAAAPA